MGWIIFEITINFLEMLTSCFFATKLFDWDVKKRRYSMALFIYAICGTILLALREYEVFPIPDFLPALLVFFLYSWVVCKAKIWTSILWAVLNYLLIGIIAITCTSASSLLFGIPIGELRTRTDGWIMICVVSRLLQLLVSELIVYLMQRFKRKETTYRNEFGLLFISAVSVMVLMLLWNFEIDLSDDFILYTNIFVCLLILSINFIVLVFKEILYREKDDNEELKEHNRLISMQIRNQDEITVMYDGICSLKHDMNNHLYTISGYMQMKKYAKAEEYIQNIIGEISTFDFCQSGNQTIDVLMGSKTTLARNHKIRVNMEIVVPEDMEIASEDLVILLGNLYDNAIDANLKIEDCDRRFITVSIINQGDNLIISFENAAIEENKSGRGVWRTTKKDSFKHGFGINNIDRIVREYDGYCKRELVNNVFSCQIRIPIGENGGSRI